MHYHRPSQMLWAVATCASLLTCATWGGCSGNKDRAQRCSQAVRHVMAIGRPAEIPPDFQDEFRRIEKGSLDECNREGLSEEQLTCILNVKTPADLARLRTCPAIGERLPTWIHVPAPSDLPSSLRLDAGTQGAPNAPQ